MSFETTITYNIMKYLNNIDFVIMEKVKGESGCSGRADINGCYKGRSVRIEVKTPDNQNKPSKKQLWNLWKWHRAKAITMVVYSLDTVKRIFDMWDKGERKLFMTFEEENGCTSFVAFPLATVPFTTIYRLYYNDNWVPDKDWSDGV